MSLKGNTNNNSFEKIHDPVFKNRSKRSTSVEVN